MILLYDHLYSIGQAESNTTVIVILVNCDWGSYSSHRGWFMQLIKADHVDLLIQIYQADDWQIGFMVRTESIIPEEADNARV